jgi:phosphate transporter
LYKKLSSSFTIPEEGPAATEDVSCTSPTPTLARALPNTPTSKRNRYINHAIDLHTSLSQLKQYITLNLTGFVKILKKYDKVTNSHFRDVFLTTHVKKAYPFLNSTMALLEDKISRLLQIFAHLHTHGDLYAASEELAKYLREQVVWERNTIWRDMISQERKIAAAGTVKTTLQHALEEARGEALLGPQMVRRFCGVELPEWAEFVFTKRCLFLTVCLFEFFILTNYQFMKTQQEQNCLAILVLASTMWATEVRKYDMIERKHVD